MLRPSLFLKAILLILSTPDRILHVNEKKRTIVDSRFLYERFFPFAQSGVTTSPNSKIVGQIMPDAQ